MAGYGGRAPRRAEDVKVDTVVRPGWITAADRLPSIGEMVYCAEGQAEVVRVLGKTESGRLLELKLVDRRAPFFAAAGNVLVSPDEASVPEA